jgi:hypothetical protein
VSLDHLDEADYNVHAPPKIIIPIFYFRFFQRDSQKYDLSSAVTNSKDDMEASMKEEV